jgi:diguanylate cyclase (GGDEF)-like protein
MLDIDHFKRYNLEHTHPGADALLRKLASFLQTRFCRRGGDIACRYGGEEFVLVLPEACLQWVRQQADLMREEVQHLDVTYEGARLPSVTLSLGVAGFPEHGDTAEALLQAAAYALKQAKQTRNCVVTAEEPALSSDGSGSNGAA